MRARGTGRSERLAIETTHRAHLLLAISTLIILGTSPVFWHHLPFFGPGFLLGTDHLGAICLTALRLLLAPVHQGFHLILIAGIGYAVLDRWRAWRRVRVALAPLEVVLAMPNDTFWRAAEKAGLDPRRIQIIEGLPNPAFTAGFFSPRVYLARELEEFLPTEELEAVIAHEAAHVCRLDPLRLSTLRFLAFTLFWIPALRKLADDMCDETEVLADDAAQGGRPLVIASAILRLADWRSLNRGAAAIGFHRSDLLDRRIRRLAGEDTHTGSHVTRRSIVSAFAALTLVWTSGLLMAHPLASGHPGMREHCKHAGVLPYTHLFCVGFHFSEPVSGCPHHGK